MNDNPYQPPQVEKLAEPPLPEGVIPSRADQFTMADARVMLVAIMVIVVGLLFSALLLVVE
jgi:hypothetical protein